MPKPVIDLQKEILTPSILNFAVEQLSEGAFNRADLINLSVKDLQTLATALEFYQYLGEYTREVKIKLDTIAEKLSNVKVGK